MLRNEIHDSFVRRFSAPRLNPVAPVTADDLHRVERELKVTFPTAYFTFLTRYGPNFMPGVLELVTGSDSGQSREAARSDLREFFVPDEIVQTHRLYSSGGMEDWLVPVAMDSMGNVFGFKREEHKPRPDDGPVFFFDHDFCEIHQEAASFDAWLAFFLQLVE
jgi:hypothetical protein